MGKSIKKISRELMISKNTVKKALRSDLYQPYTRENCKSGLLTEFMPFLMEGAPQVDFNAAILLRELKKRGYAGSYTILKEAVRPLRETHRQMEAATARFETPPGLQAQMDWGSKKLMIGGQLTRIKIFVMVLGFSRAIYVEFTMDETLPTLIACHEHAFNWFGGIPEEILYDNPRTIVLDRATANVRIIPSSRTSAATTATLHVSAGPTGQRRKARSSQESSMSRDRSCPGRSLRRWQPPTSRSRPGSGRWRVCGSTAPPTSSRQRVSGRKTSGRIPAGRHTFCRYGRCAGWPPTVWSPTMRVATRCPGSMCIKPWNSRSRATKYRSTTREH